MKNNKKLFIAGNWKMNLTRRSALSLARKTRLHLPSPIPIDVCFFPPFTLLDSVREVLPENGILLGAQNFYPEEQGAFTGEISLGMIRECGATAVLIGHSERRHILGESIELLTRKLTYAIEKKVLSVFCVGEKLEEKERNETKDVIAKQLLHPLLHITEIDPSIFVIAYEPVWAIGTGRTASPEDAEEVHELIRSILREKKGSEFSEKVRIIYGGSVNDKNAKELLSQKEIEGVLVGGASLREDSWKRILDSALSLVQS